MTASWISVNRSALRVAWNPTRYSVHPKHCLPVVCYKSKQRRRHINLFAKYFFVLQIWFMLAHKAIQYSRSRFTGKKRRAFSVQSPLSLGSGQSAVGQSMAFLKSFRFEQLPRQCFCSRGRSCRSAAFLGSTLWWQPSQVTTGYQESQRAKPATVCAEVRTLCEDVSSTYLSNLSWFRCSDWIRIAPSS